MGEITVAVDNLEKSAANLLQNHLQLKQENVELKNSLKAMEVTIAEKEETISGLIEKNRILNVAQTTNPDDRRDIKKTINEMIREVDKCIAQLNK